MVATYKYDAEDTDELSFEKGEIISVVSYDDPETQASSSADRLKTSNAYDCTRVYYKLRVNRFILCTLNPLGSSCYVN